MRGHISVKLDVFSFGILVLEIITGQKNTELYQSHQANDLLGYVSKNSQTSPFTTKSYVDFVE